MRREFRRRRFVAIQCDSIHGSGKTKTSHTVSSGFLSGYKCPLSLLNDLLYLIGSGEFNYDLKLLCSQINKICFNQVS